MAFSTFSGLLKLFTILNILFFHTNAKPCQELSSELRHFPCNCQLLIDDQETGVSMTCDAASFAAEMPSLPRGAPIFIYKHSNAGLRSLPPQIFSAGNPIAPLRSIDLSGNSLRRLSGGQLYALKDTLLEVRLADNLLGDTLNPILSTGEFRNLAQLRYLDISRNGIRAIEAGILRGCEQLQELYLNGNRLTSLPAAELGGPIGLKALHLQDNLIDELPTGIFSSGQIPQLEILDLSGNGMVKIAGQSFIGTPKLAKLYLSRNRLARFDSDAFEGTENLRYIDLSDNYLTEFPGVAFNRHSSSLTYLDLSSNRIKSLDNNDLGRLNVLLTLNLSRNEISNLAPGTFLGLRRLKHLDMSVNSLRAIEDDAFEGLDALEKLTLTDNNILLVPASALGRLPRLVSLELDFNRIAAVSGNIVGSVAERAEHLSLARNVIRELPDGTFRRCKQLIKLDLSGNLLGGVPSPGIFSGTENTLQELLLSYNKITSLPNLVFSTLHTLDLSNNRLTNFPSGALANVPQLKRLNLSENIRLANGLPGDLLGNKRSMLIVLDLKKTGLRNLPLGLLSTTPDIEELYLSDNSISELSERSFMDLRNLSVVDLSNNRLTAIRPHAFINAMSIRKLILSKNRLVSYTGETFNTGTGLEELDLSDNRLAYMSPTSFRIHPRLKYLSVADNRLTYFPAAELIAGLQYLETLDLSGNRLVTVDELDFSRMPRLQKLSFARNSLETVGDLAFHNSSQLQFLDLSTNKINRLSERSLEGLIRLRLLDLSDNKLNELPETLLDRSRLQALDSINLSKNDFSMGAPLRALRRQHFALTEVNLAENNLTSVPADDSVLVNVEKLDLSYNPLSEEAVNSVLSEPKTVRVLNLANTGLKQVNGRLETPFLKYLNLSNNNITEINTDAFERTSLLEGLDLSNNLLKEVSAIGKPPNSLKSLYLSDNLIERVSTGDLSSLTSLQKLQLARLPLCTRLEREAFAPLKRLSMLDLYGYPRLGYLDVRGLLRNLPGVQQLNIESMDPIFGGGGENIISELHPVRLKELGVHGERVSAIAPGVLSNLRAPKLVIRFMDTSLISLPPTLFFPVPRSTEITLDVTGSKLNGIPAQLLAAIDDRRGKLSLLGLSTIPLVCDCNIRSLRQHSLASELKCAKPEILKGVTLSEVKEEDLICGQKVETTQRIIKTTTTATTKIIQTQPTEPDIIWSVESHPARSRTNPQTPTPNNDDTLIIGIVGGVVSFIAVLIIGICIVRLRSSSSQGHSHQVGSVCACSSVKGAAPMYAAYHAATLARTPNVYQQPYFVPYPTLPTEDKMSHR